MCQTGPYMVLNWKKERKRDHVLPDKQLDLKIWKYVSIDVFHCHPPSSIAVIYGLTRQVMQ
jgi:hypothetical protein